MVTKTFTCDGTADGVRYPQTVSESRILGMRQYAHTAVSAYWCIRCIQYPCILVFVSIRIPDSVCGYTDTVYLDPAGAPECGCR